MSPRVPLALAAFLLIPALPGQQLPRGRIIDRVVALDNPSETYALYLPAAYSADRAWPILYCLDPGARGRVPVERFAEAAEKEGFLVAGSNNSRNGPVAPSEQAIGVMVADTHARFSLDDSRLYAAGLSGGARLALGWALNGRIAGVVASSAGFGSAAIPKNIPFRIYATAGVDDFNHDELYRLSRELARRGTPHRFVEFEGGHEWLPAPLALEALEFFAGKVPPQAAPPSKEQEKLAARFETLLREVGSAGDAEKAGLIRGFLKDAAQPQDTPDRRLARRVVGSISIEMVERGRELMAGKQYADAARLYETGVLVRPDTPGSWYALAVAQSAAGNTRRALQALEKAEALGFRDAARMEQEPLFLRLHKDPRYQALLQKLR